ncbi:MAG: endonuclease/exonuclease/phosphatase family protein, partial [Magnetovibrio sp.]|nr:endonuclease/exonuclease/phosphatase family protein [Magnetovibrio sp.]
FNMESLDDQPPNRGGRGSLDNRVSALRPQLVRLRADILCLQEVNGQFGSDKKKRHLKALDQVLKGTVYEHYHRACTQSPSGRGVSNHHNLVVLSKFPILGSEEIWNHLVDPPEFRCATSDPAMDKPEPIHWDRPFLYVDVDLGHGQKMVVVNVHLRAPRAAFIQGQKTDTHNWKSLAGWAEGYFLTSVKAAGQALEVRTFLERLFDMDPKAMVCVAGDFNCTDHEAPARIIRGDEDDMGDGEFASRMLVAAERSLPTSQRFSVIHRGQGHMVDHIFLSQGLMGWLHHIECHNEALHDEVGSPAAVPNSPQSYHAPLVAELTVQIP